MGSSGKSGSRIKLWPATPRESKTQNRSSRSKTPGKKEFQKGDLVTAKAHFSLQAEDGVCIGVHPGSMGEVVAVAPRLLVRWARCPQEAFPAKQEQVAKAPFC